MQSFFDEYNRKRVRTVNDRDFNTNGRYVLYWMHLYRRFEYNHSFNYALACSKHLNKPLVIYEGLKLDYPWSSRRLHTFILQGMQENQRTAKKLGLNYWPFVETPDNSGRGLLRRLADDAAVVVTDDFPAFIIPEQTAALAQKTDTPIVAVDGNCIVPLDLLGDATKGAAHLRRRIHKEFAQAWEHRAGWRPQIASDFKEVIEPPFELWDVDDVTSFVESLPVDDTVPAVAETSGGSLEARKRLDDFIGGKLARYAEDRSPPVPPKDSPESGLSPYLHFGHIGIEEIVERTLDSLGEWSLDDLSQEARGKRDGFYCGDANVNGFLDEAITWRDVGFQWHWHRRRDTESLEKALPEWALKTLREHADDKREYVYTLEQWENGETHDDLWNAAQKELVATGRIQNYMRMVWGKKVVEWSATIEDAYKTLEHLNNKYALDGRNPNSYTGILWCFGLFDRAWGPERKVFGKIRYMSSENTAKKFKLRSYLEYVKGLPSISEVRNRK
ncbi:MAG: deoxyribodipyrimidine photolyase [Gemmataceae bacterium]